MTLPSPVPRRILLVDDEPIVLDSIRRLLQFDGHSVEVAASGAGALALLQESYFDLVVTDYEMPVMKGDKLAAAIKAIRPQQPVLMATAYGEQLRSSGNPLSAVDAIIAKPFQMEELRQAIASLLVKTIGVPSVQPG
jgi:CheY-like chemotaxis protein